MDSNADPILAIIFLGIVIFVYFIPTWIASARKHHNANAIFVTNILLGWTFLGWVASLIWSFTAVKKEQEKTETKEPPVSAVSEDEKKCPFCAETIKREAKVCRYCNRELGEEAVPS